MKRVKFIRSMISKLNKQGDNPQAQIAMKTLQWALDDIEDFAEVIPDIKNPEKKVNATFFDSNTKTERWITRWPLDQDVFVYRLTKPHLFSGWWVKKDVTFLEGSKNVAESELERGLFGMKPSSEEIATMILEGLDKPRLSWIKADIFYRTWKDWFRTRAGAIKYLEQFYEIDFSGCVILESKERKELAEENGVYINRLKGFLKEQGLEFVYKQKINGEDTWFMKEVKDV